MELEPPAIEQNIPEINEAPRDGGLLFSVAPMVMLGGVIAVILVAYQLPKTSFVSWTAPVVALIAIGTSWKVFSMIKKILPGYIDFVQRATTKVQKPGTGNERYVNALVGSGLGFWEYNISNGEAFFSARMMAMLGYPSKDKADKIAFWYESIHPDDADGVKREMEYYLDGRTPEYSIEYRLRRANGEYLWVMDTGRALRDQKGRSLKLSGVTEDISNVKRVQEVLEARTNELESAKNMVEAEIQNARKFQKAVDSSTEAVTITRPDGVIVYVNAAWVVLNGYSNVEAMGRNARMLKSPETRPEIFEEMWQDLSSKRAFHTEDIVNRRRDGTTYLAELSIFPITEGGQTLFYVSLCQDISLRKEIDRAKTEFVSLASHQLRTPLSAIRWYSEMLLSKYVGELNEKQQQYVHEIYTGNLRMVDLVNSLLSVSRIDLGTFAIEPEEINLVEICESVLSELAPQVREKHQTVERLFARAPRVYLADPKLIRIIFQNFLSNSVKYTQEDGMITVEISAEEKDLHIRVADNGCGIPENQQSKIFQKLFRADNVRQKDTEGTGLGMYIVKAIVTATNGKISFESKENHGTTFHVRLPLSGMIKKVGTKMLS